MGPGRHRPDSLAQRLSHVLHDRRAQAAALVAGGLYLLLYVFSIGDLVLSRVPLTDHAPAAQVVDGWWTRMFRARVAYTFEPIAALYVTQRIAYFLSPVNLLLGGTLAALLGVNVGLLAFALRRPDVCGRPPRKGLLASAPALLLGFACCAPTVLLALGSAAASATLGFIALRTAFYPVAAGGLALALWLNLRRVKLPGADARREATVPGPPADAKGPTAPDSPVPA